MISIKENNMGMDGVMDDDLLDESLRSNEGAFSPNLDI